MSQEVNRNLVIGVSDASSAPSSPAPDSPAPAPARPAKPARSDRRHLSKLSVVIILSTIVAVSLALFLVILPATRRNTAEQAYHDALASRENEELMSSKLADVVKLHYKKGDFESIRPYLDETLALYDDGSAQLEVLNDVNEFLYSQGDWVSLSQLLDMTVEIAIKSKLDQGTIDYLRNAAENVRQHAQ